MRVTSKLHSNSKCHELLPKRCPHVHRTNTIFFNLPQTPYLSQSSCVNGGMPIKTSQGHQRDPQHSSFDRPLNLEFLYNCTINCLPRTWVFIKVQLHNRRQSFLTYLVEEDFMHCISAIASVVCNLPAEEHVYNSPHFMIGDVLFDRISLSTTQIVFAARCIVFHSDCVAPPLLLQITVCCDWSSLRHANVPTVPRSSLSPPLRVLLSWIVPICWASPPYSAFCLTLPVCLQPSVPSFPSILQL